MSMTWLTCMSGLDGKYRYRCGQVFDVGDFLGGAEVGRVADPLQEGRGGNERLDVGDAKVVSALLGGLVTEGLGEEVDVSLFVTADLDESLANPVGIAGRAESVGVVGLERFAVEGGL